MAGPETPEGNAVLALNLQGGAEFVRTQVDDAVDPGLAVEVHGTVDRNGAGRILGGPEWRGPRRQRRPHRAVVQRRRRRLQAQVAAVRRDIAGIVDDQGARQSGTAGALAEPHVHAPCIAAVPGAFNHVVFSRLALAVKNIVGKARISHL
jgi:hypothetical protein